MVNFRSPVTNRAEKHGPVAGFAVQAAELANDVVHLAELQARLAKADAKLAAQQAKVSVVSLIVGSCLALASLPVLTLGLAALLGALTGLNVWQSQLLVGVVVALIALVAIYLAIRGIGRSMLRFRRSAEQFANNVAWFKAAVTPRSTTPRSTNSNADSHSRR